MLPLNQLGDGASCRCNQKREFSYIMQFLFFTHPSLLTITTLSGRRSSGTKQYTWQNEASTDNARGLLHSSSQSEVPRTLSGGQEVKTTFVMIQDKWLFAFFTPILSTLELFRGLIMFDLSTDYRNKQENPDTFC